jgi:hypothetical protein
MSSKMLNSFKLSKNYSNPKAGMNSRPARMRRELIWSGCQAPGETFSASRCYNSASPLSRRGGRVAEGGGLLNRYRG